MLGLARICTALKEEEITMDGESVELQQHVAHRDDITNNNDFSELQSDLFEKSVRPNLNFRNIGERQNYQSKPTIVAPDPNVFTIMKVEMAAEYLGMSVSTLNKWRCHGGGPLFMKLGRAVRYRREDLDAFIAERMSSSTSAY